MNRRTRAIVVGAPPVLCALIGLTHPLELTAATSEYWRNMHLALIPIFPLIGAAAWLLARQAGRSYGLLAALFGYGFAIFYTALDILAGVAGGALVTAGQSPEPVFAIARLLGPIGVLCLVLGCVVAGAAAFRIAGVTTLPGTFLACIGAALLQPGHIYAGLGTLAMLLLGGGFVVLALQTAHPKVNPTA